jgi:hypothetical protein
VLNRHHSQELQGFSHCNLSGFPQPGRS